MEIHTAGREHIRTPDLAKLRERRQVKSWFGETPPRRATRLTEALGSRVSATISSFSATDRLLRGERSRCALLRQTGNFERRSRVKVRSRLTTMSTQRSLPREHRASNGIFYKVVGEGEPLLLLHGFMVSGAMFDPLVNLLQSNFRIIIPDLRGHGHSRDLPGPYDVASLAVDLDAVLDHVSCESCVVLGYSHGGAVAQQFAHKRQARVKKLLLTCTYAHKAATLRERIEANILVALLALFTPRTIANLIFLILWSSKNKLSGAIGLNETQVAWLRALIGANRASAMRAAARGLVRFDSRPWLKEIAVPTVVIGGACDTAVPRHHLKALVNGIPGARGLLVERAEHWLLWTHTRELGEIIQTQSLRK
jgi:3-oxoadipate enol-lactonase